MTFKLQVRWRHPAIVVDESRRRWEVVDRFVIVKRDADDSGYADRDVTLRQLRDRLLEEFIHRPKVKP